jgi:hypothetical protein
MKIPSLTQMVGRCASLGMGRGKYARGFHKPLREFGEGLTRRDQIFYFSPAV